MESFVINLIKFILSGSIVEIIPAQGGNFYSHVQS